MSFILSVKILGECVEIIIKIEHDGTLFATIVDSSFSEPGVSFITPNSSSLQLGFIAQPEGKSIKAHYHRPTTRELYFTNEVLIIRKGKLRVDFYNEERIYLESYILKTGDIILLEAGGHGFEVLEEVDIIEVKQGPYVEGEDKDRFDGVDSKNIVYHKASSHD